MADPTWIALSDHEMTMRMGPVKIDLRRWGVDPARDEWAYEATIGDWRIARGHHRHCGAPLETCKADAIAAVEAWRDSIRIEEESRG